MELKPAHEAVLENIGRHCRNLAGIEKELAGGKVTVASIPSLREVEMLKTQQIGGLAGLLDTLDVSFIPIDQLDGAIKSLKAIEYPHLRIQTTIQTLERRKA